MGLSNWLRGGSSRQVVSDEDGIAWLVDVARRHGKDKIGEGCAVLAMRLRAERERDVSMEQAEWGGRQ